MDIQIKVFVDIYRHDFSLTGQDYYYGNICAINPDEQASVDKCIDEMANNQNELIIYSRPIMPRNTPKLIQEKVPCIFNITKQIFEFKGFYYEN